MERTDVAVVGAGQAGLAISCELTRAGVRHLVLERGRIGQSWRDRWDTFCLVTPNWTVQLPDGSYDGPDPDGFMPRDEIAEMLERYAVRIRAPVREGVRVTALRQQGERFVLQTSMGQIDARRVVLASGAYQAPHRPPGAAAMPDSIVQLDVGDYRNPGQVPPGSVLIIGSGQSGCQIAEELVETGREVVLSCGRAPWLPRRIGQRDGVWWAVKTGFLDQPVESLPDPSARLWANLQNSGHDGGHDLNLRTLRDRGVRLCGHFLGIDDGFLTFADDLVQSAAWGDEQYRRFATLVRTTAAQLGLPEPALPAPEPFAAPATRPLPVAEIGAVIFAGGFRPAYRSWLPWPDAFDDLGFPLHSDGESTVVPGLHFIGVHFLRKRKSSLLIGVGEDARVVASRIAAGLAGSAGHGAVHLDPG